MLTREHVGVTGLNASVGSIDDGSAHIGVNRATGSVTAGNHEADTVGVKAGGGRSGDSCTHIHTIVG